MGGTPVLKSIRLAAGTAFRLVLRAWGEREGRAIAKMNFNDLVPAYQNGNLAGWTCSRCGWSYERDIHLADIDALAIARAEFINHTCSPSAKPESGGTAAQHSYFLLSKVCGFESGGVLVVDPQTVKEFGTEDEAENAFYEFSLTNFADECQTKLQGEGRLVFVSKVVSECDVLGNTHDVMRDDLKVLGSS